MAPFLLQPQKKSTEGFFRSPACVIMSLCSKNLFGQMSNFFYFFWPSLVTLAFFVVLPQAAQWPEDQQALLSYAPYVLAAILMVLAHPFRQGRIAVAALLCALLYYLMQSYLQQPMYILKTQQVYVLLAMVLPINWLVLCFCQEQPPISPLGMMAIALGGAQLLIGHLLIEHEASFEIWLTSWLKVKAFAWSWQPLWALIILFGSALIVGLKSHQQRLRFDLDILFILLITGFMLGKLEISNISTLSVVATELILFGTLFYNSYQMAFYDELTQLPGRRALVSDLKHASRNYCMAMTDVDHFKKFNDTYGHDVGDDVLKLVASKLAQVTGGGRAYRYGGEEFAVVFRCK